MKIRLHDNSVRLRLTQSEVARLAAGDRLEQATVFSPSAKLICSIGPSDQIEAATATFADNRLAVLLPKAQTIRWASGADVGIESHQTVGGNQLLHVLVEKDFACLHSASEQTP